ncbi:putative alkaline phytoceramidase [Colletotrichum sublineola]|uniref:Putative alkaline phytoceramidase n=1 Tax=Colletotrichum sublineola TaxID=1173701 RepID=A0A066X2X1_COLSU|nr:putative alkaline phytoceramidase [Colletotrichum sublineola]
MASSPLFQALRLAYNEDVPEGYWGEKTSTLNFCEEKQYPYGTILNVDFTYHGFFKTFTNLLFLWLGFKGVHNCVSERHPRIFLIAYLGYLIVGLGSTAFHTSLKYPMQLIDELSMIYTTCLMVFATFSFSKSLEFAGLLGSGLALLAGFITVVLRSLYVMETQLRPVLAKRNQAKADGIIETMWIMVGTGLGVFLLGFLIWNLDNAFCSLIRGWRRQLGLPWGVLLEGHAWWHLMTGIAYYYITWGIWLRRCLEGREDEYKLVWPRLLSSIPLVVRAKKAE